MLAISNVIELACFNVAHWIFAFQYFKISRSAPHAFNDSNIIKQNEKCDSALNKIMMFFNILLPVLFGICNFFWNYIAITDGIEPFWLWMANRLLTNLVVLF